MSMKPRIVPLEISLTTPLGILLLNILSEYPFTVDTDTYPSVFEYRIYLYCTLWYFYILYRLTEVRTPEPNLSASGFNPPHKLTSGEKILVLIYVVDILLLHYIIKTYPPNLLGLLSITVFLFLWSIYEVFLPKNNDTKKYHTPFNNLHRSNCFLTSQPNYGYDCSKIEKYFWNIGGTSSLKTRINETSIDLKYDSDEVDEAFDFLWHVHCNFKTYNSCRVTIGSKHYLFDYDLDDIYLFMQKTKKNKENTLKISNLEGLEDLFAFVIKTPQTYYLLPFFKFEKYVTMFFYEKHHYPVTDIIKTTTFLILVGMTIFFWSKYCFLGKLELVLKTTFRVFIILSYSRFIVLRYSFTRYEHYFTNRFLAHKNLTLLSFLIIALWTATFINNLCVVLPLFPVYLVLFCYYDGSLIRKELKLPQSTMFCWIFTKPWLILYSFTATFLHYKSKKFKLPNYQILTVHLISGLGNTTVNLSFELSYHLVLWFKQFYYLNNDPQTSKTKLLAIVIISIIFLPIRMMEWISDFFLKQNNRLYYKNGLLNYNGKY